MTSRLRSAPSSPTTISGDCLNNLTPADVYFGRGRAILMQRERIKRRTVANRRLLHRRQPAQHHQQDEPLPPSNDVTSRPNNADDGQATNCNNCGPGRRTCQHSAGPSDIVDHVGGSAVFARDIAGPCAVRRRPIWRALTDGFGLVTQTPS